MFSEDYLRFFLKKLESTSRSKENLRKLLSSEKVSLSAYEEIGDNLKDDAHAIRKAWKKMIGRLRTDLEEIEKTIKVLEIQQAKIHIEYAASELNEETYWGKNETFELGISALKKEAKKMKELLEGMVPQEPAPPKDRTRMDSKILPMEKAFYFYVDLGQYTGKYARSLKEFAEIVRKVEAKSLKFHLVRGDFQSWIRDLGYPELALTLDELKKLKLDDEELRNRIYESVKKELAARFST